MSGKGRRHFYIINVISPPISLLGSVREPALEGQYLRLVERTLSSIKKHKESFSSSPFLYRAFKGDVATFISRRRAVTSEII